MGEARAFLERHVGYTGNACVIWPFAIAHNGYGVVGVGKKTTRAHREMCRLAHGEPPAKLDAAHSCGVRACVNPRHVRWATRSANLADRLQHGTLPRGETHAHARLTAQDVAMICRSNASNEDIAAQLNVDRKTVAAVRDGVSWQWLTGLPRKVTRPRQGTNSPNHRLTEAQVLQIYADTRMNAEIASEIGCDRSLISRIKNGYLWASVTGHQRQNRGG